MNKLLCLAIVVIAPISVFAGSELQELGWVVSERETSDLNGYTCTSNVYNDGVNQFVEFITTTFDPPCKVFVFR